MFLLGAFGDLFSTLFAALAAWTRQYADMFGQIGLLDFFDTSQRKRCIAILAWVLPILWALVFIFIKLPVLMVISGGIAGSFLLILVVWAVLYFRYTETKTAFIPSKVYDLLLWLSALTILWVAGYGIYRLV